MNLTFALLRILPVFLRMLPKKRNPGDIILYPYAFEGSDGYIRRFREYFRYLDQDGLKYRCCNVFTDVYARSQLAGSRSRQYWFYLRVLWKRVPQVAAARNYRAAFIQRGLFPVYFDLKHPHLERMIKKINPWVTIDFWDSVFERQGQLVAETVRWAHQLSLSNEFLMDQFPEFTGKRVLWKVAVNLHHYQVKTSYTIEGNARLFWTGLPHNLPYIERYLPILREVSEQIPLTLVLVCQKPLLCEGLEVEYHPWEASTFFKLLQSADVGIYPEFNSVVSKGKSTMKVMDYLSTGLPMIGVPYGLPSEARDGVHLLIAEDFTEWKGKLLTLLRDESLRRSLGTEGRKMVESNYSLERSYEVFKTFAFKP